VSFAGAMIVAVAAPAAGQAVIPSRFAGEWQRAITQCGGDQENTLRISSSSLTFYEAVFEPRKVRRSTSSVLVADGMWHEDRNVRVRLTLTLSHDRKHLVVRSPWWTNHLVKCA
jgi:hypothetical protein